MGKHGTTQRGRLATGVLACLVALSVSATGARAQGNPVPDSTEDSTFSAYGSGDGAYGVSGGLHQVPAEQDAFSANRPIAPEPWNRAVGLDLSLGSLLINTVFFPVKLAVGLVGAEVGGLTGAMNGGDEEAAAGVWNVTTDGSYFVTPAALDGRERFTLGGDAP